MRIFIVGINGKMGRAIAATAESAGYEIVGGLDVRREGNYPVYSRAADVDVSFDCLIDFSRPSTLDEVIALSLTHETPAVIATTGYSAEELEKIDALSRKVPVFRSANMSLGVNVVEKALTELAAALKGFDIEIIEAHHNQKADAPSGTAKQLLDAVRRGLDYAPDVVYGREGESKRKAGEIGVHAVRGGTIVGEHTVLFAGDDELIEIKHTALSRRIFANGSLRAAEFLQGKTPGLYHMTDYLASRGKQA